MSVGWRRRSLSIRFGKVRHTPVISVSARGYQPLAGKRGAIVGLNRPFVKKRSSPFSFLFLQ